MLKFEGLLAFNELSAKAPKSLKPAFYPRTTNKKTWQEAVEECLKLESKSCEQRLEAYKEKESNEVAERKENRKRPRRPSLEQDSPQPPKLHKKILRTKTSLTNNVNDALKIEILKTSLIYKYQNQANRPSETNQIYHRLTFNMPINKTQNTRSGIRHQVAYRTVTSMQFNQ